MLDALLQTVVDIVDRRTWKYRLDNKGPEMIRAREELAGFLSRNKYQLRFHGIASVEDIAAVWGMIRQSTTVCDFAMDITNELRLRCMLDREIAWDGLQKNVAESLGFIRDKATANGVADEDFRERGFDTTAWNTHLTNNPWLVTLYLLQLAGVDEAIIRLSQNLKQDEAAPE